MLSKITLAGNESLQEKVVDLAQNGVLIDCYVALACAVDVFDPDNPTVRTENISGSPGAGIHYPVHVPAYIPMYFNVRGMSASDIGQLVVASAALPFGIVPASLYQGREFVDGGMADNCPMRPLVDESRCDVLISIHLRPKAPLGEDIEKHCQATWKLTKMHECRSHWSEHAQYNPDRSWWDSVFPVKLGEMPAHLPVMPDMDIGGLLDFTKNSIDQRIAEGHKQGQILADALLEALGEDQIEEALPDQLI